MKTKKTYQSNLENKKVLFFEIGVIFALAIALMAFEWSGTNRGNKNIIPKTGDIYIEELAPITNRDPDKIVEPPPPVISLIITPDFIDLDNPTVFPSFEGNENDIIRPVSVKEEQPDIDSNYIFNKAEEMPKYRGKEYKEFGRFIGQHLQYPVNAAENEIKGIVKVRFVINEKGDLVNAAVIRSVHHELDKEALRVVNLSEKWTPGKQHGKPVKVAFVFPIGFNLSRD